MPLASPAQVGSAAISAVHCVSASTNTRSNNSSSGVTRDSSRRTAVRPCERIGALAATIRIFSGCGAPLLEPRGHGVGRVPVELGPRGQAQRLVLAVLVLVEPVAEIEHERLRHDDRRVLVGAPGEALL